MSSLLKVEACSTSGVKGNRECHIDISAINGCIEWVFPLQPFSMKTDATSTTHVEIDLIVHILQSRKERSPGIILSLISSHQKIKPFPNLCMRQKEKWHIFTLEDHVQREQIWSIWFHQERSIFQGYAWKPSKNCHECNSSEPEWVGDQCSPNLISSGCGIIEKGGNESTQRALCHSLVDTSLCTMGKCAKTLHHEIRSDFLRKRRGRRKGSSSNLKGTVL